MNMDEERQKQEAKELEEKRFNLDTSDINSIYEEIAMLREHIKKYPLDWENQMNLSWLIFSCEGLGDPEQAASIDKRETAEILQRVVDYCPDMNLKASATNDLVMALTHLKIDHDPKMEERINKLIASLPSARYSREMIVLDAGKNTPKGKHLAFDAAKAHIGVLNEVFILMELYGSEDDKVRIKETKTALANLMDLYDRK